MYRKQTLEQGDDEFSNDEGQDISCSNSEYKTGDSDFDFFTGF